MCTKYNYLKCVPWLVICVYFITHLAGISCIFIMYPRAPNGLQTYHQNAVVADSASYQTQHLRDRVVWVSLGYVTRPFTTYLAPTTTSLWRQQWRQRRL